MKGKRAGKPMPRLSEREWQAQQNLYTALRHEHFRMAAEAVAAAVAEISAVRAVALFGSVAGPPELGLTRRGRELLHYAKDVDLAVWIDRLDQLAELKQARIRALSKPLTEQKVGVAHHQVDAFLIEPEMNRYLGRLCSFASCPKGKVECDAPGCGQALFLKQHLDFELDPDALNDDRVVLLYDRGGAR